MRASWYALALLLMVLLATACTPHEPAHMDTQLSTPSVYELVYPNPEDVAPVQEVLHAAIEWRVVSHDDLNFYCGGQETAGCAFVDPVNQTCVVFAADPIHSPDSTRQEWDFHLLGHEILHCYRGAWHSKALRI